jgi:glyoxylase-like metal-dependent hydrolase (beta-lactamase superfamily II)
MTSGFDINCCGHGLQLGKVEITRVQDYYGPGFISNFMFPEVRPEMFEAHKDWLVPTFYNPESDKITSTIHSWLVRTEHHTILIDGCVGNHKERPHNERFNMRNEPWLERLARAGARPEDVDFVMCTHLHADHVGWNTRLVDGRWVPTFPNAKYIFSRKEFERWDTRRPDYVHTTAEENVFEDSILPIAEAGQMLLVEDGYTVDDLLTVESAIGHTPGHAKIRLKDQHHHALFCGDVIHHPIQLPYPEVWSRFDDDRVKALETRLAVLNECVDHNILMLPMHFAEPFVCRIKHNPERTGHPSFLPIWGP